MEEEAGLTVASRAAAAAHSAATAESLRAAFSAAVFTALPTSALPMLHGIEAAAEAEVVSGCMSALAAEGLADQGLLAVAAEGGGGTNAFDSTPSSATTAPPTPPSVPSTRQPHHRVAAALLQSHSTRGAGMMRGEELRKLTEVCGGGFTIAGLFPPIPGLGAPGAEDTPSNWYSGGGGQQLRTSPPLPPIATFSLLSHALLLRGLCRGSRRAGALGALHAIARGAAPSLSSLPPRLPS